MVLVPWCAFGLGASLGAEGRHPRGGERAALDAAVDGICSMWPRRSRGGGGCDGLLRDPLFGVGVSDEAARGQLGRRISRAVRKRKKLTVVLLGDSVAAGHDNYYNQSFGPLLVELLGPALAAAGAELVVENFAVGNIGEYPLTAACLASRLGDRLSRDADVVTWNWELYYDSECEQVSCLRPGVPPLHCTGDLATREFPPPTTTRRRNTFSTRSKRCRVGRSSSVSSITSCPSTSRARAS